MGCGSAGWSAVSSAGANSALAGVLAGFMLNGIVVLLSRTITDIGKVRALGLLLAAFVALGLDSYLFGLVTGDKSCHRAWTEAMLAAGLLAVGTVAIIAGFGLLVAEYVEKKDSESVEMLTMLFDVLRLGVALVVLSLLLILQIAPLFCLLLLWSIYLSLSVAGQIFMNFQWDYLLLEVGFLSIFLAPLRLLPSRRYQSPLSPWAHFLLRWLLNTVALFVVVKLVPGFHYASIVSLAIAFGLPKSLDNGQPFPMRNNIIFLSIAVVLFSLLGQGLTLPLVVKKVLPGSPRPVENTPGPPVE